MKAEQGIDIYNLIFLLLIIFNIVEIPFVNINHSLVLYVFMNRMFLYVTSLKR